jgi:hypothetical protein
MFARWLPYLLGVVWFLLVGLLELVLLSGTALCLFLVLLSLFLYYWYTLICLILSLLVDRLMWMVSLWDFVDSGWFASWLYWIAEILWQCTCLVVGSAIWHWNWYWYHLCTLLPLSLLVWVGFWYTIGYCLALVVPCCLICSGNPNFSWFEGILVHQCCMYPCALFLVWLYQLLVRPLACLCYSATCDVACVCFLLP